MWGLGGGWGGVACSNSIYSKFYVITVKQQSRSIIVGLYKVVKACPERVGGDGGEEGRG